jgi:hypothetical protein
MPIFYKNMSPSSSTLATSSRLTSYSTRRNRYIIRSLLRNFKTDRIQLPEIILKSPTMTSTIIADNVMTVTFLYQTISLKASIEEVEYEYLAAINGWVGLTMGDITS